MSNNSISSPYSDPELAYILTDASKEYMTNTPILSGYGSFLLGEKSLSIDPESRTITLDLKKAYRYIPDYEERMVTDREIFSYLGSGKASDYGEQSKKINTLLQTGVGGKIEYPNNLKLSFTEIPIFDGKYVSIALFPKNHHTFPGAMKIPGSLHFDRTPFQAKKDITQSIAEIVNEIHQERNPTNIPLIKKRGKHIFSGGNSGGLWRVVFAHGKGNPAILKDCIVFLDASTGAFEIIRIKHQLLPKGGIDSLEVSGLSTHPKAMTAIVDLDKLSQCFLDLTEGSMTDVNISLLKRYTPPDLSENIFPLDDNHDYQLSFSQITPIFRVFLENYSKNIHTLASWVKSRHNKIFTKNNEKNFEKTVSLHLQDIILKKYPNVLFEEKRKIHFQVSSYPEKHDGIEIEYRDWIMKNKGKDIDIEPDGIIWNSENQTYTLIESKKTKNLQNAKEQLFRYRYLSDFILLEYNGQSFYGNGVYAVVEDIQGKINPPGGVRPIFISEMNADFFQKLSQK